MTNDTFARYIIGIDLGTTNCAVSYVDTSDKTLAIHMMRIPQVVFPGHVEALLVLPSFYYLSMNNEWPAKALDLPWKKGQENIVGKLAQEHGARVPTNLVESAKSWLCHPAANRKDKILPLNSTHEKKVSPVEATKEYLLHIKNAWNHLMAKGGVESEFEAQEIVLTVPASFDEVARRLTIESAKLAGYRHLTLLEEPQSAFYSWISEHQNALKQQLKLNDVILVCDVGGGTTDFSLIEVQETDGLQEFVRMSVGDHLLLGGDNMDAAVAYLIEQKLKIESSLNELKSSQWLQLKAQAKEAKEFFFNNPEKNEFSVFLQGAGSSFIGGSYSTVLKREEITELLREGFFGLFPFEEALKLKKQSGFRNLGLGFEEEPSITKHLAAFFKKSDLKKTPRYVLFNGGSMKPQMFQERILESIALWFMAEKPSVLSTFSLDLAVARGASYYGKVRRGIGTLIKGGIPRAYYLGVDIKNSDGTLLHKAMTILERGSVDGDSFEPKNVFNLRANQPVSFHLYTSQVRLKDKLGEFVDLDEKDLQTLPPIHTVLRLGKSTAEELIPARLHIGLTSIGTLELWLQSAKTEHRFLLEFQTRQAAGFENSLEQIGKVKKDETFDVNYLNAAKDCIVNSFENPSKHKLMETLENLIGIEKKEWSSSVLRALFDASIKISAKRKLNAESEARWWNIIGFCLRPGFGFPLDDFRIKELWKIILNDFKEKKSFEIQIQQAICYRRIAGGLNKGQQNQLANRIVSELPLNKQNKIVFKAKSEEYLYSEKMRAFASFEYAENVLKLKIAKILLQRIMSGNFLAVDVWSIGRIGARHLAYGSMTDAVSMTECSKWIEELLNLKPDGQIAKVLIQLARKTNQREINISNVLVNKILEKYKNIESFEVMKKVLTEVEEFSEKEQEEVFGDKLPPGLVLIQH